VFNFYYNLFHIALVRIWGVLFVFLLGGGGGLFLSFLRRESSCVGLVWIFFLVFFFGFFAGDLFVISGVNIGDFLLGVFFVFVGGGLVSVFWVCFGGFVVVVGFLVFVLGFFFLLGGWVFGLFFFFWGVFFFFSGLFVVSWGGPVFIWGSGGVFGFWGLWVWCFCFVFLVGWVGGGVWVFFFGGGKFPLSNQ